MLLQTIYDVNVKLRKAEEDKRERKKIKKTRGYTKRSTKKQKHPTLIYVSMFNNLI